MYSQGEPLPESMRTINRSSVHTNDAVYGYTSHQNASSSTYLHSSSRNGEHHGSSKLSINTKHQSKMGHKSTEYEADKKKQQSGDLAGIGAQFDNNDCQYVIADDGTYDDEIILSIGYSTGA